MAGKQNFTLEQGSKKVITITVWDGVVGGTLKDLTGLDARMQIRSNVESSTILLSLTSNPSSGISINTGTSVIVITITAVQAAAITVDAVYDLELLPTGTEADAIRYLQGAMLLSKEVTR